MNTIEQIAVGGGHREVGLSIGRRLGEMIHRLLDNYALLQERPVPFHRSATGRSLYRSFLELHRTHFPEYLAELEGIAQGAERPFDEIFSSAPLPHLIGWRTSARRSLAWRAASCGFGQPTRVGIQSGTLRLI